MDLGPLPAFCSIIISSPDGKQDWGKHALSVVPHVGDVVAVDHAGVMKDLRIIAVDAVEHDIPVVHAELASN